MEIWKPVVGYEGAYEVSDLGRVRLLRYNRIMRGHQARYTQVSLHCKTHKVHVLVALAFIGPRPPGLVVRHLDGNTRNNVLSNIAYGTHQENSDDMRRHGTVLRGDKATNAKLKASQVAEIRRLSAVHTQAFLAGLFNMSNQQISNIVRGAQWL